MVKTRWLVGLGVICMLAIPRSSSKLRIAVGAIISPAKSLIFYEELFDYMGEKLGREVEMVQRKTYAEVKFLLREGVIDAAFVCPPPARP